MAAEIDSRRGYHDIGGTPGGGPVDTGVTEAKPWEKMSIAIANALGRGAAGMLCTDEIRRSREEMGEVLYRELGYFEKSIEAMSRVLIEKQILTREELEGRMAEIEARIGTFGR